MLNHNPRIVTDGLVLCLDAANPKSYPGSGTTWFDLSGNENDGTLVNGVGYSSDNNGSLVFDGTNDYIQGQSFTIPDYITVSCWINTTQTDTSRPAVDINTTSNDGGFSIVWRSGSLGIPNITWRDDAWSGGNYPTLPGTIDVRDGNWHMLTGVYDNVGAKLYIDGTLNVSTGRNSALTQVSGQYIRIGLLGNQTGTYFYSGNISNVQIYNRALTEAKIKQNFNALRGRYNL